MRKLFCFLFTLLNLSSCETVENKNRQANINSIFDKMERQGVDTNSPLLYGYFFYDKDSSHLKELEDALLKESYRLVRLEKTSDTDYILHVEKVEVHSRASLLKREKELDKLAKDFRVSIYDGWDVGNADPTKPLVSKSSSFEKSLDDKSDIELYKLASDFYDAQTNDKAIITFQKCIERNYKKDTCYYKQGVSYIGLGNPKSGIEKLEESLKINPHYFKACFNIGAACYDIHEYEKSIEFYQKAANLEPKNDTVFYGIAASQFALGEIKEAEINCELALKINPKNSLAKALRDNIRMKK